MTANAGLALMSLVSNNPNDPPESAQEMNRGSIPDLAYRVLVLILLGVVIGLAVNIVRPTGALPWSYPWSDRVENRARAEGIDLIGLDDVLLALHTGTHLAVDARSPDDYQAGTLPGALSLPRAYAAEQFGELSLFFSPDEPVITFCSSADCDDALLLALFLREQGITHVVLFLEGIEAWKAAGHPVEGGQ